MATSGSFNTSVVGSFYFTFEWNRTGYSSSANEHYIHYKLTAHNTPGSYRTVYLRKLKINSDTVYEREGSSSSAKNYYDGDVVISGDITISSSNSAGDGNISASFEAGVASYPGSNCSGSGAWALTRIPRYANFTEHYVSGTGLNSITVKWNADHTIDKVQYSLNGGGWTDTSGLSYTIIGLAPNTQYNIRTRIRRQSNQLWTESGYIYGTTKDIAKVTLAHDFNSNANPYMEFTNPSGATVNLKLEFAGNVIRRNGITSAGGYKFEITEAERNLLYSACPTSNSLTVRYVVATLVNGAETYWHYLDKTMVVVNSNPTFSNCEYKDTGSQSTRLTGDNQILLNGYNYLTVVISTSNKAVAKNGATMSKYRLVCGNQSIEADYNSDAEVNLTLGYVTNMTFVVYAIDSRGNSTAVTKSVTTWKDYFKPVITAGVAERTEQINKETKLTFSGKIWNANFGAVQNGITTCKYEYKKTTDTAYITGTTEIIPEISENTFSVSVLIKGDADAEGFELSNTYNVKITINDEIYPATYDVLLGAGAPGFAMHRNGVSFGTPYNETNGGVLQKSGFPVIADHKYYRGSCNDITETCVVYVSGGTDCPEELNGVNYGFLFTKFITNNYAVQTFEDVNSDRSWKRVKVAGNWKSWETQVIIKSLTGIVTPLSVNNTTHYDSNITRAKAIIIYFSFIENEYRDSVVIPYKDSQWYLVNSHMGTVGYIWINWDTGIITVSSMSDANFKIFKYTLIA